MSLSESFPDPGGALPALQAEPETLLGSVPPQLDPDLLRLRDVLHGLLDVAGEEHRQQRGLGRVYIFRGRLLIAPETAYSTLAERFKPLGYTPMLHREDGEEVVIALEGDLPERRFRSPWWLHLLLLAITVFTTTVMGAALTGIPPDEFMRALREWDTVLLRSAVEDGLMFSLTLLLILGIHEMGHYVAARLHGVRVTLPFFIPLPISNSLGTMGAVILIKSPLMNRRALFDVGIAGPLAGLVAALPLYVVGLHMPQTVGLPLTWIQAGISRVSNPPLLDFIGRTFSDVGNLDRFVLYGHPIALAAWFGVLLTALNLLPLGQFDGGHVSYALFGQRAWPVARVMFFTLVLMGMFGWIAWLIWAFMGLLTGLRHPPPHDDLSPLGRTRTVIGLATLALFLLIISPMPFYSP